MAKKYISQEQLSIASELLDFVNNELLPGTDVTKENFRYPCSLSCLFLLH